MGNFMAQYHGQSRLVPRRTEDPGVCGHLAAGHGEGVDHLRIVDHGKLPFVLRLICRRSNALADLANNPLSVRIMRDDTVAQGMPIGVVAE